MPVEPTTRLNLRGVPAWVAALIDAEADAKGISRESHRRSILIEYARRLKAKEGRRD